MLFAAMLCFYTQQWSVEVEKGKNSFFRSGLPGGSCTHSRQ